MKRDKRLMRTLLARIEALPIKPGEVWHITPEENHDVFSIEGYSLDEINYNLGLLREGGYLDTDYSQPMVGVVLGGLTNRGHDLLDEAQEATSETRISDANAPSNRALDPFADYDALVQDVARSNHQFFAGNLRRWLELLDMTPMFARPILQRLETSANFATWFEPYRRRLIGMGIAVQQLDWPQERPNRLGVQLLLFRRFADGTTSPHDFAFLVLNSGSNVDNGIRKLVEQIYLPFSQELRRYLSEMLEQQTPAGWKEPASSVGASTADNGESEALAPAADRFVAFDHNSAVYAEADTSLGQLAEAVRGSNELFANPEERIAVAEEIGNIQRLIACASVRVAAIYQAREGVLKWLAKTAAGGIVGHLAVIAAGALGALIVAAMALMPHL